MKICIFCGSSAGNNSVFAHAAKELGKIIVQQGHSLVYGGGNVGLMGILADTVMEHKGVVIGVIPQFLVEREVGHQHITRLEIVKSMHERKQRMADLSDAFMAIPGGLGTLEELAEILTWKQLHLLDQPVALLNTNNFFDPLVAQLDAMVKAGFLKAENLSSLLIATSPEKIISLLSSQQRV